MTSSDRFTYSDGAGHQPRAFTVVMFHEQENASADIPRKYGNEETRDKPENLHTMHSTKLKSSRSSVAIHILDQCLVLMDIKHSQNPTLG